MAKAAQTKTRSDAPASTGRSEHRHEATARPEIGVAPRFKAKAAPVTYRYDSSLSPALDWDTNPARETAAFLLGCIEDAAGLPAPHEFSEPRELKGADGAALLRIGRQFLLRWQVKLLGLDAFDPITMQPHHANDDKVPCWMLDTCGRHLGAIRRAGGH